MDPLDHLKSLTKTRTGGDPDDEQIVFTDLSPARLEQEMQARRTPARDGTIRRWMHAHALRLRKIRKALPGGSWLDMQVPQVECQRCGARRRIALKFADPKRQHTRSFERYVCELLQFMTPQDVSWHLGTGTAGLFSTVSPDKQTPTAEETFRANPPWGISWDLANDIQKRRLGKR
ncbi:MAG: hypothetical protein AB7I48_24565, partial [Planctomycetaceae bacterium]